MYKNSSLVFYGARYFCTAFFFLLIFFQALALTTSLPVKCSYMEKPLRLLVHESFRQIISKESFAQPVDIQAISGSKLRLMLQWGHGLEKYDLVVGIVAEDLLPHEKKRFEENSEDQEENLIPFAYAHIGFLMKVPCGIDENHSEFETLIDFSSSLKGCSLILNDPRFSSVGRLYKKWVGDDSILKPKVLTYAKGWSGAFALFKQPHVKAMLGYDTTAAYYKKSPLPGYQVHFVKIKNAPALRQFFSIGILKKNHGYHPYMQEAIKVLLSKKTQEKLSQVYLYPIANVKVPQAFLECYL